MQICALRLTQQALAWAVAALRIWGADNQCRIAARAEAFRQAISRLEGWQLDRLGAYFA